MPRPAEAVAAECSQPFRLPFFPGSGHFRLMGQSAEIAAFLHGRQRRKREGKPERRNTAARSYALARVTWRLAQRRKVDGTFARWGAYEARLTEWILERAGIEPGQLLAVVPIEPGMLVVMRVGDAGAGEEWNRQRLDEIRRMRAERLTANGHTASGWVSDLEVAAELERRSAEAIAVVSAPRPASKGRRRRAPGRAEKGRSEAIAGGEV